MVKRIQPKFRLIFCLSILVIFLLIVRIWQYHQLRSRTNAQALSMVETITATTAASDEEIILPASVAAWHYAPIYARTNGYLKVWYVDIGDRVDIAQTLAIIETPELDAQFMQAKAILDVALANNTLAQSTAKRWIGLLKTDSVSKQETEEKISGALAAKATVSSARANLERLKKLVNFEWVVAPFRGIITDRQIDIGDLVNAGHSPTMPKPLFRIAKINRLRIYVKIPQNYSTRIKPNMQVELKFSEYPGEIFTAKLLQTAHAIDPTTRTLLAEFIMENPQEKILPGGYTQMILKIPRLPNIIRLPINALIFRAEGTQVATVNQKNQVILKSITIRRDFGREFEVDSGITPGERIILNPSDSISNGEQVRLRGKT